MCKARVRSRREGAYALLLRAQALHGGMPAATSSVDEDTAMTSVPTKPETTKPETTPVDESKSDKGQPPRTLGNRPVDPNAMNQKPRVPPGVDPDDVWDPGSSTPGAPPVDNRS